MLGASIPLFDGTTLTFEYAASDDYTDEHDVGGAPGTGESETSFTVNLATEF
jgi:hypothetical protein